MAEAKKGDKVKIHYTGTLPDGMVFDSSADRDPLEFTLGNQDVIPGFESAVMGMNEGESKTVTIVAKEAYGPRQEELITEVDRGQFPPHIAPEVGQQLEVKSDEGFQALVTVTDVAEDKVTLDANHPLAGRDLTFEIELVSINA